MQLDSKSLDTRLSSVCLGVRGEGWRGLVAVHQSLCCVLWGEKGLVILGENGRAGNVAITEISVMATAVTQGDRVSEIQDGQTDEWRVVDWTVQHTDIQVLRHTASSTADMSVLSTRLSHEWWWHRLAWCWHPQRWWHWW